MDILDIYRISECVRYHLGIYNDRSIDVEVKNASKVQLIYKKTKCDKLSYQVSISNLISVMNVTKPNSSIEIEKVTNYGKESKESQLKKTNKQMCFKNNMCM